MDRCEVEGLAGFGFEMRHVDDLANRCEGMFQVLWVHDRLGPNVGEGLEGDVLSLSCGAKLGSSCATTWVAPRACSFCLPCWFLTTEISGN